jgi:prepilin-type N-terminal cleavage/methylation domain-containing protein
MMKFQKGFTLIEALVYLALFGILFGGSVVAVFNIIESNARDKTMIMVQDEGSFMLRKINWALSGATAVDAANSLSINKAVGIDEDGHPNVDVIAIKVAAGDMMLVYSNEPEPNSFVLNNSNVKVFNFELEYALGQGVGTNPESIKVSFRLNAKTDTGSDYFQDFQTAAYLKK